MARKQLLGSTYRQIVLPEHTTAHKVSKDEHADHRQNDVGRQAHLVLIGPKERVSLLLLLDIGFEADIAGHSLVCSVVTNSLVDVRLRLPVLRFAYGLALVSHPGVVQTFSL